MRSVAASLWAGLACSAVVGCGSTSTRQTSSRPTPATPPASQSSPPSPPSATTSRQASQAAVVETLHRYEHAYSARDATALASLLTASVRRYGAGAGGCETSTGRSAVIAAYQSQFDAGSGKYRLSGLSPGAVDATGDGARVALPYRLSSGSSGSVRFVLHLTGGTWQISSITASCAAAVPATPVQPTIPTQTPPPTQPQVDQTETVGSSTHAGDAQFCSSHSCIPNFPSGNGAVIQCADGQYSHSGGISGSCSSHGGNG